MTPNEYQQAALSTLVTDNSRDTLSMCALGIAGEAGELCDILKKHLFHKKGTPLNAEKIADELGDLCWYIAAMAQTLNIAMEDITIVIRFDHGSGSSLERIGLGMAIKAGAIAESIRGNYRFPIQLRRKIQLDLHNIMVSVALLASHIDLTPEQIMQANIDKLAKRHKPNGEASGFQSFYASDSGDSLKV